MYEESTVTIRGLSNLKEVYFNADTNNTKFDVTLVYADRPVN